MGLKEYINQKYGEWEKSTPLEKSELFLEIYKELCLLMERDFETVLRITPITVEKIEKNEIP